MFMREKYLATLFVSLNSQTRIYEVVLCGLSRSTSCVNPRYEYCTRSLMEEL